MTTLKEEAKVYVQAKTKNIADLDRVPVDIDIVERQKKKTNEQTGLEEEYTIKAVVVDGEDYRVPVSVLNALKEILEEKPEVKFIKVKSSGEGFKTKYTVVTLD